MKPRIADRSHFSLRTLHLRSLSLALVVAAFAACASTPASVSPPHFPPVTSSPTNLVLPGKFVWADLVTRDIEGAKTFYNQLFGWTFEQDGRYTRVMRDGEPIAGMIQPRDPDWGSAEWVSNLSVADVDAATTLMGKRGGVIEHVPVDAPDRGRMSLVSDPDGALLLLVRATGGDPADAEPALAGWLWTELWSRDVDASIEFYSDLVGYTAETRMLRDAPYHVLKRDGEPRAGVVAAPQEVHPLWLPYLRVADAAAIAEQAEALGARIILQNKRTVIMVDPTGAPIGLQVWSRRSGEEP